MESNEHAKTSTVSRKKRLKWALVAIIVAAIVVVAGFALVVPGPKAKLTVTDGSITGTIQGDFLETDSDNAIWSYFNATTIAGQPGHPDSTLTLQLITITHWDINLGWVETAFHMTVLGVFDANLSAQSIQVVCNQTAYQTAVEDMESTTKGTNVSFDEREMNCNFWGNGSGTLTAKLVNRSERDPLYRFSYSSNIMVWANQGPSHDGNLGVRYFGIRVSVNGWFEPEFSVGILFKIINTPNPA